MADPATAPSPSLIDPHTPTDPSWSLSTPALANSSPDTPHLQTPAGRPYEGGGSRAKVRIAGTDGMDEDAEEGVGLGFGSLEGVEKMPSVGPTVAEPLSVATEQRQVEKEDEADSKQMPDAESLRGIKRRLDELREEAQEGTGVELVGMVDSVLLPAIDTLPFLQSQLESQRLSIRALQQQNMISSKVIRIERERHAVDRMSWQATVAALERQRDADVASGARVPRRVIDLDVGYHQELESANKRLEMDNRLMRPRIQDMQLQVDRLVSELRHLRSQVVLTTSSLAPSASDETRPPQRSAEMPMTPAPNQRSLPNPYRSHSPNKAGARSTTMGDARAEHLLLAARKVRVMRVQNDRVGRLTFDELQRSGVLGQEAGPSYREGYPGYAGAIDEADDEEDESELEEKPHVSGRRGSYTYTNKRYQRGATSTPMLKSQRGGKRPPVTPAGKSGGPRQPPHTTPGGNFTDLLRAAEMATRPTTPTRSMEHGMVLQGHAHSRGSFSHAQNQAASMSATRSTTRRGRDETPSTGSPVKRARRLPPGWGAELSTDGQPFPVAKSDDSEGEGALDLLLQASQIESGAGGSKQSSNSQALAPAIDLRQMGEDMIDPTLVDRTPTSSTRAMTTPKASAPARDLGDVFSNSLPRTTPMATGREWVDSPSGGPSLGAPFAPSPRAAPRSVQTSGPPSVPVPSAGADVNTPRRPPHSQTSTPNNADMYRRASVSGPAVTPLQTAQGGSLPGTGGFDSPTGAQVMGLGKFAHLTSTVPARRVRSPYLKWTAEEDELLARAVAMHGEKWDLVSKGVPTRSYHQVRQRWLRKTGAFEKKMNAATPSQGEAKEEEVDEQRSGGSPTPAPGKGKKRRASLSLRPE